MSKEGISEEESPVPGKRIGAAAFYGVTPITITRWKNAGRKSKDPCPLGEPSRMPEWWARVSRNPVPDSILSRAGVPVSPLPSQPVLPAREYDITPEDRDPRQMLARLEQEEARLHRCYMDALSFGGTDFELDQHRNRWTETSNLLQLQRGRVEKSKSLLDPGEVNAAFRRIVQPLPAALERAFPKEPPTAGTWLETVRAAIRTAFAGLPASLEEVLT